MLKKQMKQFLSEVLKETKDQQAIQTDDEIKIEIYKEEKDYAEKYQLIADSIKGNVALVEKKPDFRFSDAYIERCDKETEKVIAKEAFGF